MTMLSTSNFALLQLINGITGESADATIQIGLVIIFFCLPAVLLGGVAGVFVDRWNKQHVLFWSNCLRALVPCGFVALLFFDRSQLLVIYLLTFLLSSIGQFFTPAEGSVIPMLVNKEELMPALSLFQVTSLLSTPLGFMLFAPILLTFLPTFSFMGLEITPIVLLYLIMAVLYGICAILIARIPSEQFLEPILPTRRVAGSGLFAELSAALRSVWKETAQAWAFIYRHILLFVAVIQLSFAGVLLLLISNLAPPLVTDLLHLSPKRYPNAMVLIFAPAGIALAGSSLLLPRITARLGKSRTILIGCLFLALMIAFLPLSTTLAQTLEQHGYQVASLHVLVAMLVMFFAGIALNCINTPANTMMQEQTPGWIKGRVLALQLVLYNGSAVPIILLVGILVKFFTLSTVLYMLAATIVCFGWWGFYYEHKSPSRGRERETEKQVEEEKIPDYVLDTLER
jgi:MFS family permease